MDQLEGPSAEDPLVGPLRDQEGERVASASPAATSLLQESKSKGNKTVMYVCSSLHKNAVATTMFLAIKSLIGICISFSDRDLL